MLVDSGQGVAKADWYPAGQARRQPQHPLFPAAAGQVADVEGGDRCCPVDDGQPGAGGVGGVPDEAAGEVVAVQEGGVGCLLDRAIAAARAADVVVLMVGTNQDIESRDRDTTSLPGPQDELAERVLDAKPSTAIIVNAGRAIDLLGLEGVDHPL